MKSDSNFNSIRLSSKDYLSLAISLIALTISGISFYYSNLRVDDNLQARVVDMYIEPILNDSLESSIVRVAFLNAGNRQATVLNTLFTFAPGELDKAQNKGNVMGNLFDNQNVFPVIVQPHEVKIIDLKLSFKKVGIINLKNFYNRNDNQTFDQTRNFNEALLKLEYVALDSKANFYNTHTKDFRIHLYYSDKEVKWHCLFPELPEGMPINDQTMNDWKYESTSIFKK